MLLFEFDDSDPLLPKLVAVSDQLYSDLKSGEQNSEMTLEELLKYFSNYDIVLDKKDVYNMIQQPPLNNIISNIQGDKVVFKGEKELDDVPDENKNQEVVKAMADKAAKNLN